MPSASLQSRIQAFEALSSESSTTTSTIVLPLSMPTADNRTVSSNLLESPISPTANTFHPITPFLAPTSSNRPRSPSLPTPSLAGQASLIDLKDWIVEDGPVERPSAFRHTLTAGISKLNGIRESSKSPSPSRRPTPTSGASSSPAPLINVQPPSRPRPPLPPRKPSFNTADFISTQCSPAAGSVVHATLCPPGRSDSSTAKHTYPPDAHKFGVGRVGHASASSVSSFHTVSLSSDGSNVESQSPKLSPRIPSFTFETDTIITDVDTASIAESFENVSVPSTVSPSTAVPFDWERAISKSRAFQKLEPPILPSRPGTKTAPIVSLARSVSTSTSSTATSTKMRRPPPPPPPYQPRSRPSSSRASVVSTSASISDRSSTLSNTTTTSRTSTSTRNSTQFGGSIKASPLLRPTPIPPFARLRYESLFNGAVRGRRKAEKEERKSKLLAPVNLPSKKGRQAAGWRGLSVDLITNPEDHPVLSSERGPDKSSSDEEDGESPISPEERLDGRIVQYIWSASRLDRKKLWNIWNDSDPQGTGFIDRDAFVRGMWQIDEELRRAQLARHTSALTAASSQRIPHRPVPPPRPKGTTRLLT